MFLKKIIVEGFKSIAHKTEIDFINDVNVIMGPNGSGKSNVFECIEWVLGSKSAKQLRADNMESIIFDGGENGKPAEKAEATLVFDNKDRAFDLDTDEVLITRKLVRDKGNEYYINKEHCKLKDIMALLENKGIGKNNYAITGQNKITEFLLSKPQDIRTIIEEAAGISSFRNKKNEIINSLNNYDNDLDKITAVLSEMNRGMRPLKKQIQNAEKYEILNSSLTQKQYYYYTEKIKSHVNNKSSILATKDSIEETYTALFSDRNNVNLFLNNYDRSFSVLNKEFTEIATIKNNIKDEIFNIEKELSISENKIINLKDKRESNIENIKTINNISLNQEKEKDVLYAELSKTKEQATACEERFKSVETEIIEKENIIASTKKKITEFNKRKENIATEIQENKVHIQIENTREENILFAISNKTTICSNLKKDVENSTASIIKTKNIIDSIKNNMLEIKNIDKQLKQLDKSISYQKNSQYKRNQINDIKSLFKNVQGFIGVLFELISYDKTYDIAINSLFGSILNNFVVTDTKAANECIDILKRNKIQPLNFIILSSIKNNRKEEKLNNAINAIDVLTFDSNYRELINEYFSNNYISTNVELAEKSWNECGKKHKVVSLDGQLFNGNMVKGGYISKNITSIKKEIDELKTKKIDLLMVNELSFKSVEEMEYHLNHLISEIDKLSVEIDKNNKTIDNEKKEIALLEENKQVVYENSYKLRIRNSALESEKIDLEKDCLDIESILETENKVLAELINTKTSIDIERNKLITLIEEQEKRYAIYFKNNKEDIEKLQANIEDIDKQILNLNEYIKNMTKTLSEKKQYSIDIAKKYNDLYAKVKEKRDDKENKLKLINDLNMKISELENKKLKLDFNIENIDKELNLYHSKLSELQDIVDTSVPFVYKGTLNDIYKEIVKTEDDIKKLGFINTDAINEYAVLKERYDNIVKQRDDLNSSKNKILEVLQKMEDDMLKKYTDCFNTLKKDFDYIFKKLFNGGSTDILMEDPQAPLESGVIIKATPPGKKNKPISLLSGGEKSLAAVSFIFALLKYNPSPLVIFDEIDAALDEINVSLLADYISNNSNVQYILVSHRVPMMKIATVLYGASMSKGVTELLSQRLNKNSQGAI